MNVNSSITVGLTYAGNFSYSALSVSPPTIQAQDLCKRTASINVTVTVANTGSVPSDEVAQLYLSTAGASVPLPPRPELRAFARLSQLKGGESRQVTFALGAPELSVLVLDGRAGVANNKVAKAVEPGARKVYVGGGQPHVFEGAQEAGFTVQGAACTVVGYA